MLGALSEKLEALDQWDVSALKTTIDSFAKELGWKPRDYYMPLRLVVCGRKDSPPLIETIEALGLEVTRSRLMEASKFLKV